MYLGAKRRYINKYSSFPFLFLSVALTSAEVIDFAGSVD